MQTQTNPDSEPANPAAALSAALKADMAAVNAQILERMSSPVALIPRMAGYLIGAGGKRIRPLLTLACTAVYGGDMKRAATLAAAVEFIHTATLLHDDVVDESAQRRSQPSANAVFGNKSSVLVGDFLFSRAFQAMVDDGTIEVLRILSDAAAIIAQGEVMQLEITQNLETTFSRYLQVVQAKTAALFAAACQVGPVIAGAGKDAAAAMAEYGLNLGIAFQMADDALDYSGTLASIGKTPGDDFREGKLTAPVLFALEKATPDEQKFWRRVMGGGEQTAADFKTALQILGRTGALEQCLDQAGQFGQKARLALAEAPDHPFRALLDDLVIYAIRRSA